MQELLTSLTIGEHEDLDFDREEPKHISVELVPDSSDLFKLSTYSQSLLASMVFDESPEHREFVTETLQQYPQVISGCISEVAGAEDAISARIFYLKQLITKEQVKQGKLGTVKAQFTDLAHTVITEVGEEIRGSKRIQVGGSIFTAGQTPGKITIDNPDAIPNQFVELKEVKDVVVIDGKAFTRSIDKRAYATHLRTLPEEDDGCAHLDRTRKVTAS